LQHVTPDRGPIDVAIDPFNEQRLDMAELSCQRAQIIADQPILQGAHPGGVDQRLRQMLIHLAIPGGQQFQGTLTQPFRCAFGGGVTGERLACYYVPQSGAALEPSDLRVSLAATLPAYMIPNAFIARVDLPLTASGKVDRRALPRPDLDEIDSCLPASVSPKSDLESRMLVLWKRVLKSQRVGIADNFFDLGGDSVTAIQTQFSVADEYGITLSSTAFFNYPTIASLVEEIRTNDSSLTPATRP